MNEILEKKTEQKEPVKIDNGLKSDESLHKLHSESEFFLEKPLNYVVETKEATKVRIDAETTEERKRLWLEKYADKMGSYLLACKNSAVPKRTFYYWLKHDSEFRAKVFETKQANLDVMEDVLVVKAGAGNVTALKFWLESNHPTYNKRIKVETYTGAKTLEDLIDDDEDNLNKNDDDNNGEKKNKENELVDDREPIEDQKQEGEDRPISA